MSLQINMTPLSPNADLAHSCAEFFHAVAHHPQTDQNPFDIWVLTTATGTQIEAIFDPQRLSLDIQRTALHDASLGDALFEIAKHGPCAIWSDAAKVAAITDPQLTEMTATALGLDTNLIEPVSSGSDLFDVLFGVEPPRTASPHLESSLVELGCHIDHSNQHRATLRLEDGHVLEMDPDEHFGWRETEGLSLGVANPRFATVMTGWAPDLSGPLAKLDARKRRQDRAGFILWSGHLRFAGFPATAATSVLGIYDKAMSLGTLVAQLTQTTNPKKRAQDVFGGPLAPFVMPTEGLWVFLFLMVEAGCTPVEIYDIYSKLKSEGAAFGTQNSLSMDIIDAYLDLHQSRLGKGA